MVSLIWVFIISNGYDPGRTGFLSIFSKRCEYDLTLILPKIIILLMTMTFPTYKIEQYSITMH